MLTIKCIDSSERERGNWEAQPVEPVKPNWWDPESGLGYLNFFLLYNELHTGATSWLITALHTLLFLNYTQGCQLVCACICWEQHCSKFSSAICAMIVWSSQDPHPTLCHLSLIAELQHIDQPFLSWAPPPSSLCGNVFFLLPLPFITLDSSSPLL